ncbi:tripartite motif containing 35-1 [Misgurnus anguillicaudatus]|uniref:tripartite motif containing 35-1 n=1 Tax=Misgurnus anguillicaudatus TaxID=75329 RepID=UPI003CCFCB11
MALEEDLSCPVCTELFREPVLLSCGHSYCRGCITDHWTTSRSRSCPVCRQLSPHEPLSNLSLRNACETYLKERRSGKKKDEGLLCHIHGEKVQLFCQTDELPICAECKKHDHSYHKTQTLQQTVRLRKGKLKAALRPIERTLSSLQNGTAQDAKVLKYIQSQTQKTEQKLKEQFKKLHQFLKKDEESRIAALNKEEKGKREKMERRMKGRIQSLSDMIREVEEEIKDDDISFLQNYNSIMNRIEHTDLDPGLCSETLIDVSKHLENLKYTVWEKMKDICPYYPMTLNPNTVAPCFSVSDDLTTVTSCVPQNDPNPLYSNRMVLGNVGYGDGIHTFKIEVGNSRHWTLGVCLEPLSPEDSCWGLRRNGDLYCLLTSQIMFKMNTNPEVVRVKIEDENHLWGRGCRKVSFFDARTNCNFAKITGVPSGKKIFPFVIPEKRSCPLRLVPADVTLTIEQNLSFQERHRGWIDICVWFVFCLYLIFFLKSDTQSK